MYIILYKDEKSSISVSVYDVVINDSGIVRQKEQPAGGEITRPWLVARLVHSVAHRAHLEVHGVHIVVGQRVLKKVRVSQILFVFLSYLSGYVPVFYV